MTMLAWTPPDGMAIEVAKAWRAFYRTALLTYGITPAEYRALYLAQLGRCYICQKARGIHPDDPRGAGDRRLGVDHNHLITGKAAVRGLLCSGSVSANTCNRLIARYPYDALVRATVYLIEAPAQRVLKSLESGIDDDALTGSAYHS